MEGRFLLFFILITLCSCMRTHLKNLTLISGSIANYFRFKYNIFPNDVNSNEENIKSNFRFNFTVSIQRKVENHFLPMEYSKLFIYLVNSRKVPITEIIKKQAVFFFLIFDSYVALIWG